MCILIKTPAVSIISDGGACLGPRDGLLPHPEEYKRLSSTISKIDTEMEKADIITVSHYHFDHYRPPFNSDFVWTWSSKEEVRRIYQDKKLLVKDIRERINFAQRRRGWFFLREVEKIASVVEHADRRVFHFGDTEIRFSRPVPHGEKNNRLGYVLCSVVSHEDEKIVIAPDVQGPAHKNTTDFILAENPDIVFVGGPPTYLVPSQVEASTIARSIQQLTRLATETKLTVVDHHLMRDRCWKEEISLPLSEARKHGNKLKSAARYMRVKEELLESKRSLLYKENPPSEEFMKWTKISSDRRRTIHPPV